MPDRTQMFSVSLTHQEIEGLRAAVQQANLKHQSMDWSHRVEAEAGEKKLAAALSQPEHQGEEGQDAQVGAVVDFLVHWRFCPVATASNPSRSCLEDAAKQLLAALPAQPPAPVLSGEERERIGSIAAAIHGAVARGRLTSPIWTEDAAFLRTFASQERRGEETDRARADRLEVECRELEDANRSLAKMRDKAAFPPPSDSQGDRERCDGDGLVRCRGCSNCRPELIREEDNRG